MNLRPLILDDKAKVAAQRVLDYADRHHYRPGSTCTPGNNPGHVARFGTYRAVFSYTHSDGLVFRHLLISVPSTKYPNPVAAAAIAGLFGFTGWDDKSPDAFPADWLLNVSEAEHCVVIAQPLAADMPRTAMS